MSLMPTGDKGQRYEILATGWPFEGETITGWAEKKNDAERMAGAVRVAPSCTQTRIRDRWHVEPDQIEEASR